MDKQTDRQTHTHTHTHKAKPKHPRHAGCNKQLLCNLIITQPLVTTAQAAL